MVERARLPPGEEGAGRRSVREVRLPGGRRERFDAARLSASIHRAAAAVGQGEELLAEELAALVALVLEDELGGEPPTARLLRETVERVLMETGHHDVARSYILMHAAGAHDAGARAAGAERGAGDSPQVASLGRECLEAFDAARISTSLVVECGLARGEAAEIAGGVEAKVRAHGGGIVSTATLRDLVAAELFERRRGDLLARVQGLGMPAQEIEGVAFIRGGSERAEARVGGELLRRLSLTRLLDAPVAAAHLGGDLHVDGLGAPGRALEATLDLRDVRRAAAPGALAAILHLVHALEPLLHGPLALHHVERALAPGFDDRGWRREAARTLLLALAEGPSARGRAAAPRRVLGLGADLPPADAAALFRRGCEPDAVRAGLRAFVVDLLEQAVAFSTHLQLPRLRLLVDPGDEERELKELAAALQPALALGLADVQHASARSAALRLVGARVALNVARRGLLAGRRRERDLLHALPALVEQGLSAGTNVLRPLLQRDEIGLGFMRRLREIGSEIGRDLALDLPGGHSYHLTLVPVGVDAAVRAVTERDPGESEGAARLRDDVVAALRAALPPAASATRFELSEEPFPDAELRFGRLDWLRFPRVRDLLGLAHDGAAFRYAYDPAPPAMAMAAADASPARSSRPSEGSEPS